MSVSISGVIGKRAEAYSPYAAPEYISNFSSKINIEKDGSLIVTEDIAVITNQDKILHGIYRDFPTMYKGVFGNSYKGFTVLEVKKDGVTEPFSTENLQNGVRVYIGDKDTIVEPGAYTYSIKYKTTDQLGFFDEHDELYWNINGNGWDFETVSLNAEVHIPAEIDENLIKTESYIGEQGSKLNDNNFSITKENGETVVRTVSSRVLQPKEGLTVVIGFPKGIIAEPPIYRNAATSWLFGIQPMAGIALVVSVFGIYYITWLKKGRDEVDYSTIPVQFEPPKDLSPSDIRLINSMGVYDNKYISTAIVNMAINGYVKIKNDKKEYKILRTSKSGSTLTGEEKIIYDTIFPESDEEYTQSQLKFNELTASAQKNGQGEAVNNVQNFVKKILESVNKPKDITGEFTVSIINNSVLLDLQNKIRKHFLKISKKYIVSNSSELFKGFIPFLLFFLVNIIYVSFYNPPALGILFFTLFWSSIVGIFVGIAIQAWVSIIFNKEYIQLPMAIFMTLFLSPFIIVGIFLGVSGFGLIGIVCLFISIGMVGIFYKAFMKRNKAGSEAQLRIEGLKTFLLSQEEYIKSVKMTIPEKFSMYEKYLPFAIALDVEPQWSEQFKNAIEEMFKLDPSSTNRWYVGDAYFRGGSVFSSGSFGNSFTSSISSASVNPSSSSGFSGGGGGGSSGGGGGGGGGGGW